MKLRRALALLMVVVFYLQPATVYADVYSGTQYNAKMWPPGYSPPATASCQKSGVVATARNYTIAMQKNWIEQGTGAAHCGPNFVTVGSGYLSAGVHGYRDGAYCGGSGQYPNNGVPTGGWQLWVTVCVHNPSGYQYFSTYPENNYYDCCGQDFRRFYGPMSPGAPY